MIQTAFKRAQNFIAVNNHKRPNVKSVERVCELLRKRKDIIASAMAQETGKPKSLGRDEVQMCAENALFVAQNVDRVFERGFVQREKRLEVEQRYEPRGVLASIGAWNYPVLTSANVLVPALACGNAVLFKPSELASGVGELLAQLLHDAELATHESLHVVVGGGDAGSELCRLSGLGGVFFTGSVATGRRIAHACADTLVPTTLELGSNDAVYVHSDVDLAATARIVANGAMYNAGQSCSSVERCFVHQDVYAEFVEHLRGAVSAHTAQLGPLTRQQAAADLLLRHVDDAKRLGATIECGGVYDDRSRVFAATLVSGATRDMLVMQQESFGPILAVESVRDDSAALLRMQETDFGLSGAVFTRDEPLARRMLAQLDVGSAFWNTADRMHSALSWQGRRESGIGATGGFEGLCQMVRAKSLILSHPR